MSWAKYVGDSRIGNSEIAKKSWFKKHPEDLRTDWDSVKIKVMQKALKAKFSQNENLRLALHATSSVELIEDSNKDNFWGCGKDGKGTNNLGKLREKL